MNCEHHQTLLTCLDKVVISDTDDIDELGDKIDAACPSASSKDKLLEDEDSDDEKRGWRSEKNQKRRSSGERRSSTRAARTVDPSSGRLRAPRGPRRRSR